MNATWGIAEMVLSVQTKTSVQNLNNRVIKMLNVPILREATCASAKMDIGAME